MTFERIGEEDQNKVDLTGELEGVKEAPPRSEAEERQRSAARKRVAEGKPGFMPESPRGEGELRTDHGVGDGSFEETEE